MGSPYYLEIVLPKYLLVLKVELLFILMFSIIVPFGQTQTVLDANIAMKSKCCGLPPAPGDESTTTTCLDYFETERNKFSKVHNPKKIFIGGLFPLSNTSFATNGNIDLQVACLALERINRMGFIPGHQILMYYNDTRCETGAGVDALYDQFYRKPTMMMLLGCSCSEVSKRAAMIVPYWNIVMLSYASTSVALTDREYYQTFFRTVSPDSAHNSARAAFFRHFGWNDVATLIQDQELFSLAQSEMGKYFQTFTNVTIISTKSFVDDPTEEIRFLKKQDVRIIIGSFQEKAARKVFCEAYRKGMYGSKYVWFLSGWYQREWWKVKNDTKCTPQQLDIAVDGYFAVDSMDINMSEDPLLSELTIEQFKKDLASLGIQYDSAHVPHTYDAVWTIALTLRTFIENKENTTSKDNELGDFKYRYDKPEWKTDLMDYLSKIHFNGVSGPVSFNGPDRYGVTVFKQNQNGNMRRVALHFPDNGTLRFDAFGTVPIIWKDGHIPVDRMQVIDKHLRIHSSAFSVIIILASIGVLLAIVFLIFNIKYRKTKYIKLSSPNLNNILVVGCILVYTAVILCGLESHRIGTILYEPLCTIRVGLLIVGFTLAFGSMFVKTYRVYHIITHATSRVIKRKMLHESTLFLMIGVLLVIDALILLIWLIIDPMTRREIHLPKVTKNDTTYEVPIIEVCESNNQNTWLIIVYVYKGLLLLFGVFLAWETRKVKIPALNDSNYIAICVYNVVIMSVLAVVINNFITRDHKQTVSYVLMGLFIFIMTTATLCLLFVPKLHAIRLSASSDPVTRSVGLEIKGRTRRFVMDESTELKENISRAEIQMRLFRRESDKMDQKIAQLEKILQMLDRSENTRIAVTRSSACSRSYVLELEQLLELPETSIDNTSRDEKENTENDTSSSGAKKALQARLSVDTNSDNENMEKPLCSRQDSKGSDMYISSEADATYSESDCAKCEDTASQNTHCASIHCDQTSDDSESDIDLIGNEVLRHDSVSSILDQATIVGSDFEISDSCETDCDSSFDRPLERTKSAGSESEQIPTETASLLGKPRKQLIGKIEVGDADDEEVKQLIDEMQEVQRKLLQLNGNTKMIYYV